MQKSNLVEFSELLRHAETLGYGWNQAHQILVDDEVPPMYETKKREVDLDEIDEHSWGEDSKKIVRSYMEAK